MQAKFKVVQINRRDAHVFSMDRGASTLPLTRRRFRPIVYGLSFATVKCDVRRVQDSKAAYGIPRLRRMDGV